MTGRTHMKGSRGRKKRRKEKEEEEMGLNRK
jgi:hypothetical protein